MSDKQQAGKWSLADVGITPQGPTRSSPASLDLDALASELWKHRYQVESWLRDARAAFNRAWNAAEGDRSKQGDAAAIAIIATALRQVSSR